jgi:hypothetical protein
VIARLDATKALRAFIAEVRSVRKIQKYLDRGQLMWREQQTKKLPIAQAYAIDCWKERERLLAFVEAPIEIRDEVWEKTPSFRRTLAHGRRLIVVGSADEPYGATSTEWREVDMLNESELKWILGVY